MLIPIVPANYRKRPPKAKKPAAVSPPVSVLTLVSANWVPDDSYLFLTFDGAVDISAINPILITVDDGGWLMSHLQGDPAGASLFDPTTVRLTMEAVDPFAGTGVTLTAPGDTGIVAVDDGAAWNGVSGLELPFA